VYRDKKLSVSLRFRAASSTYARSYHFNGTCRVAGTWGDSVEHYDPGIAGLGSRRWGTLDGSGPPVEAMTVPSTATPVVCPLRPC
jgi:hypothetical protein